MKKTLCIVLSATMIVLSFAACSKKNDTDTTTNTDADGNAYVYVTDSDGKEVTDADGEKVTSAFSEDKTSDKKSDGKTTTGKSSSSTANSAQSIDDIEITASKDDLLPTGSNTKKTTLKDSVISKIIKTGSFTLATNIISGENKVPTTIVMDDDRLCAEMALSGMSVRLLLMKNKTYFVMPTYKMYGELTGEEYSETLKDLTSISETDQEYVKSTKVKDGSTTYTCEEYKNDSGTTVKYYFDGDKNWKRWELISGEDISIFEVSSFSGKVDTGVFSTSGLTKIDLSQYLNATTTTKK